MKARERGPHPHRGATAVATTGKRVHPRLARGFAALVAGAVAALVPLPGEAAPRATLTLDCASTGTDRPTLDCRLHLAGPDGRPLAGAQVTLGASMPSMPMAHHVEAARAVPSGTAGEYRARLALEMTGDWSLQTDVAGPLRDRIVRTVRILPCDGGRRCATTAPVDAAPAHRHR